MSDVEWDADDFEPSKTPPASVVRSDKWDGEDEEDEIKDNWEDDDETKENETGSQQDPSKINTKKKKKKLSVLLAEKEKVKQEEEERRQREREAERKLQTPEARLLEKHRLQKIQEDADLQIATDLLLDSKEKELKPLGDYDLASSEELNAFRLALLKKIKTTDGLVRKPFYITFLEDLCRDLCENLETDDIKRITTILNSLYNEKVKAQKPVKGKKKGASKAKLNVGQGIIADVVGDYGYDAFDEYDDFI